MITGRGKQPVAFVVGATGMLGARIVECVLQRGARVRALVRPSTAKDRRGPLDALAATNGNLEIVQGDVLDPLDHLARAVEGAEVIISAVKGGPDVVVDGQSNLVRAAEKAGVPRMVPAAFGYDLQRLDYGDNFLYDLQKKAAEAFVGSAVKLSYLVCGAWPEMVIQPIVQVVDFEQGTFSYWGDGDQPCDFTSVLDTAEFAAAVALDPEVGHTVRVAGEVLTMRQLHQAVERGSGQALKLRCLGTVDELKAEIVRRKAADPNPFTYVALQFACVAATGKAKAHSLDNDRYPGIRPRKVEDAVRATLFFGSSGNRVGTFGVSSVRGG
ncbi:MAG: NmrA family NAD(P)-binding protein [Gammaproteobacteria bacterium]